MKTVLLMSRGVRLGAIYSEIARDLARDHHVIGLIDESERHFWQGIPGVEAMTLVEAASKAAPPPAQAEDHADFVRSIEVETGLTTYQAARNYLLYGRLHSELFGWRQRRWLWPDEAAIVADYVRAYRGLRYLFETYRPAIVLLETPDHIYASLAQAMAYKRDVLCLGIYFAPLAGSCSMFLYSGFQPQNIMLRHYYEHPDQIPQASWSKASEMIASVRRAGPPAIDYVSKMSSRSKSIYGSAVRRAGEALVTPANWSRFAPNAIRQRLGTLRKELWLKANLTNEIPDGPFVLYFLQHQPEASAATQAPHIVDQAGLIEQIAVNAPAGWRIVVKEHPRTYPARGREFFRPLQDLPNVHLCQPAVSSRTLLERAEVVVALTGSVGMEALFAGKKVAVVGRPYYSFFPNVARLERPGDLFDALDAISPCAEDDPLLNRFAAAYYASVFDAGSLAPDGMWPRPDEGGAAISKQLRRHLELVESGAIRVADFQPNQR